MDPNHHHHQAGHAVQLIQGHQLDLTSQSVRPHQLNLTSRLALSIRLVLRYQLGLSDLSVAIMALERARNRGIGRAIQHPVRAVPRWKDAAQTAVKEAVQ